MSTRERLASLDAFLGRPHKPSRVHRSLHVERLEDRRLMYADNPFSGDVADLHASPAVTAPPRRAAAADASDTLPSREELRQWVIQIAPVAVKQKVGRAAAIEQLTDAYLFGNLLSPSIIQQR